MDETIMKRKLIRSENQKWKSSHFHLHDSSLNLGDDINRGCSTACSQGTKYRLLKLWLLYFVYWQTVVSCNFVLIFAVWDILIPKLLFECNHVVVNGGMMWCYSSCCTSYHQLVPWYLVVVCCIRRWLGDILISPSNMPP